MAEGPAAKPVDCRAWVRPTRPPRARHSALPHATPAPLRPAATRNRASRKISVSSKDRVGIRWLRYFVHARNPLPGPPPARYRAPAERHHRNTARCQPGPVVAAPSVINLASPALGWLRQTGRSFSFFACDGARMMERAIGASCVCVGVSAPGRIRTSGCGPGRAPRNPGSPKFSAAHACPACSPQTRAHGMNSPVRCWKAPAMRF